MLIPPKKEETIQKLRDLVRQKEKPTPVVLAPEAGFAEIYLEEPIEKAVTETTAVSIGAPTILHDPKKQKILAMRRLSDGVQFSNRAYERLQAVLFYHQGKFMEDFTDDYEEEAPFFMYYPDYHSMSYVQLRTFFTWRTNFRNHIVKPIPISYLYLYLYEIINLIGVKDCHEGLEKIIFLWSEYRAQEEGLDKVLTRWIKDFYILRDFSSPFEEVIMDNPFLQDFFPLEIKNRPFETYAHLGDYKIKQSAFFTGGNSEWIMDCFDHVINEINSSLKAYSADFDRLIYYAGGNTVWAPFSNALYCTLSDDFSKTPRTRTFLNRRYHYEEGKWTCESKAILLKSGRLWIGFLLRQIEQFYRSALGYKRKITPPKTKPDETDLTSIGIPPSEFYTVIKQAVLTFYRQSTQKTIHIDTQSLDQIRKNAQEVQERLILQEDLPTPPLSEEIPELPIPDPTLTSSNSPWETFSFSLSPLEKKVLMMVVKGCSRRDFLSFSKGIGKMPEVLADELNQKALETIGDTLFELDEWIAVYDDYQSELERILDLESE